MVMKYNLHIVFVLVAFFLTINIVGQNKNITSPLSNNKYELMNISKDTIVIISILNLIDIDKIQKLNDLAKKYKNKNVIFIIVTDDNLNNSKTNSSKNQHLRFLSKDENNKVFNTYQTGVYKVFPIYIILNKYGKMIYKKKGIINNIEKKLAKRINRLLDKDFMKIV